MKTQFLLLILLSIRLFAFAADSKTIFKINDAPGDDHGDGSIFYPLDGGLSAGDLDLISFAAYPAEGGTFFEAEFANTIGKPAARSGRKVQDSFGQLGFYAFNIDIYVDMDRKEGSGFTSTLPGRNATIRLKDAWEKVIFLNPRPNDARTMLRRILQLRLEQKLLNEKGKVNPEDQARIKADLALELDGRYFMPTRVRVNNKKVEFFVPDYFLRGSAQKDWSYVICVTAASAYVTIQSANSEVMNNPKIELMNLPVREGGWSDRLGSSRPKAAFLPPILDLIVPDGMKQEEILRNFSWTEQKLVSLPGVVPAR